MEHSGKGHVIHQGYRAGGRQRGRQRSLDQQFSLSSWTTAKIPFTKVIQNACDLSKISFIVIVFVI